MSEQEVKDIVHQYLKDKMSVVVDVDDSTDRYGNPEVSVTVSIFLGEEKITEYEDCS